MKKLILAVAAVSVAAVLFAQGMGGGPGKGGPGKDSCLFSLSGAKVAVENTETGVIIKVTATDSAVVAKIQKLAAANVKSGKWCGGPMGKRMAPPSDSGSGDGDRPTPPQEDGNNQ